MVIADLNVGRLTLLLGATGEHNHCCTGCDGLNGVLNHRAYCISPMFVKVLPSNAFICLKVVA